MENNRSLIYHQIDPTMPEDIFDTKWKELQSLLNSCGTGPQKTIAQWQTVRYYLFYIRDNELLCYV